MNKYILLVAYFFLMIEMKAQVSADSVKVTQEQDSTLAVQDSTISKKTDIPQKAVIPPSEIGEKKPFVTIDFGVDYLKLFSLALPDEKKYEGLAAVNFGFGMSIDGEYGYTNRSPKYLYKNGEYTFEGTYYKIGLSYNYPIDENNTLGLGVRFAESKFEDKTSYTIKSLFPGFNDYAQESTVDKHFRQWVELVLKSEGNVKKVKNLKLGMFIRIKFIDPKASDYNLPYPVKAIPGYGYTINKTTASVNLFLKYSLPFGR